MKVYKPRTRVFLSTVLCFFLLMLSVQLRAQENRSLVKGIVQNNNNESVSGVSVIIKNKKNNFISGVSADSSGLFTFSNVPSGGPYSFTFSAIGYEDETLSGYKIKEGTTLSLVIKLKALSTTLSDVVVVGYGTVKKKDLTGSVSHVKMSDME
ncbi:MAG: carboxypeptidase regulatory-like domain-containing protein, partial [Ginsengibacter sp.]